MFVIPLLRLHIDLGRNLECTLSLLGKGFVDTKKKTSLILFAYALPFHFYMIWVDQNGLDKEGVHPFLNILYYH